MVVRVAINGFGRIGRLTLRALLESGKKDIEVVAINDLGSAKVNGHLLKYDSVHGIFNFPVEVVSDTLMKVNGKDISVTAERNPELLPWKDKNIDVVFECTGIFVSKEKASAHLKAGAKKVLVSAPCENADATIVYGVNHNTLTKDHVIVSNASCTTNCLAPVAYVLSKEIGIEKGFCTTIHSYTGDQPIVDTFHAKDMRRARAGALSMIPTSTGAAIAVGLVLPELKGKLDGSAIRVPTPNVSLIDFAFISNKATTAEEINKLMINAANGELKGVLGVNDEPLVSIDFNHSPNSSTFDLTQTQVLDGNFVRIVAWYDNEWGFSTRMTDTALAMMKA
jgi:glyceraldehyde 3-phosphate dehydrogenase